MDDITLRLDRVERLFQPTPFDWEHPQLPAGPAIESVVENFRSKRLPSDATRFVIKLTSQPVTPMLQADCANALREFCRQQAEASRQAVRNFRRAGWLSLRVGMTLLAPALALSAMFDHFQPLPAVFNRLFSEGFLIIGWVVLWHPIEALLYDWVAPHRTARIYERIGQMELVLVNDGKAP